jgi:hypothetical protein
LIRLPTRLDALKRDFEEWVSGSRPARLGVLDLTDKHGYLKASVASQIDDAMKAKDWRSADVMEELGYSRHDGRLGSAMRMRLKPNNEFLKSLVSFLKGSK